MTGFSNNLPPSGSKAYLFAYLQGANWYKAQLASIPQTLITPQQPQQPQPTTQQAQQSQNGQNQQNIDTPPAKQSGRIHIEGEIVGTNAQDKSFSVRTPEGLVAIKLAATSALPPEGLRVELEIPRAREGQQIAFRPLPREQQSTAIRQNIPRDIPPPPSTAPISSENMSIPPSRAATPIIDNAIDPPPQALIKSQAGSQTASAALPLRALQKNAVITLTPLPPGKIADLLPLPQTITPPEATNTKTATQQAPNHISTPPKADTAQEPATKPASPENFAAQILQHKIGTTLQVIAQSQVLEIPETLLWTIQSKAQIIADQISLQQKTQTDIQLLPQNNPPVLSTAQQSSPQIVQIDDVILPPPSQSNATAQERSTIQTTPNAPIGQNTTSPPQTAQFIGQTTDGRPVAILQNPPPPAQETADKSDAAPRYFTANITPEAVTQHTTITFSPVPEATSHTASLAPPPSQQTTQTATRGITPEAAMATVQPFSFPLTGASDTWPALDDITKTLQQISPQAAQVLAQQSPNITSPAVKMEPAILFFLVAAQSGDIASWLGDKAASLLRGTGKDNAIHKILSDFTSLSHASREAGSSAVTPEWRSMPVPLFAYNEAHKIMLHYKYDDEGTGDDHDKRKKSMRFLIDLDLNRMGDVQLDGFAQSDRLDLIVRTQSPLSPPMQQIMRRKYSSSLEYTGFKGELGFHGTDEKFIKLEAVSEHQEGLSI